MKKLFFFAIVALGMTAACQKPDAPVDESNEPVAIQFGVQAPTLTVTKTKAAVDKWDNTTVKIIGYTTTETANTIKFQENGTIAAAADENNFSTVTLTNTQYYEGTSLYDFRGLYLGESVTYPTVSDLTSVAVNWDGDDDIMVATTNKTEDLKAASTEKPVIDKQIYSAYAARRNVHPSLTFKHLLTRIIVQVKYANRDADATDKSNQVTVTSMTIDTKTQGNINLLTGNLTPSGTATAQNVSFQTDTETGEIMIEPNLTSLKINMQLSATGLGTGNTQPSQITFDASKITTPDQSKAIQFEQGKQYTVTVKVYDLQEIEITASLEKWDDGGEGTYDPDENFFNN